jgi:mRNA interferase HicA
MRLPRWQGGGFVGCLTKSLKLETFSTPINATQVFIIQAMNSKQMKKWLEQQGASFEPGKGSHLKVFLKGKQSAFPMHGTTELGKGLEAAIKRQLGLK